MSEKSPTFQLDTLDLNPAFALYPLRLGPEWRNNHDGAVAFASDQLFPIVKYVSGTGNERKRISQIQSIPARNFGPWEFGGFELQPWRVAGIVYRTETSPSWLRRVPMGTDNSDGETPESDIEVRRTELSSQFSQIVWHIILLGASPKGWLFLHASQESMGIAVRNWLLTGLYGFVLPADTPVAVPYPESALTSYFLSGNARQTALSGIHRRLKSKPDRKSLSGIDLREAFDPLSDQTYRLTSAVSQDRRRSLPAAGFSFKNQRIWSHRLDKIENILKLLSLVYSDLDAAVAAPIANKGMFQNGYRLLATPVPSRDLAKAKAALDAAFRPWTDLTTPGDDVDLDDDATGDGSPQLGEAERELQWFTDGEVTFASAGDEDVSFRLSVRRAGRPLMTLFVTPWDSGERVDFNVERTLAPGVSAHDSDVELFEHLTNSEGMQKRLAVWYSTGHIVAEGSLTEFNWRDVLFDAWRWGDISKLGYDPGLEKPVRTGRGGKKVADLSAIGDQKSLLCYCSKELPRLLGIRGDYWSFCDDGSGETSDFAYYVPKTRSLWLVHAKAAVNTSEDRLLSVSAYEQVASQARKNVRYLNAPTLSEAIKGRSSEQPPLWRAGRRLTGDEHAQGKAELVAQLSKAKILDSQTLVVLQPHVRQSHWQSVKRAARRDDKSAQQLLYKLLCTLLADLQITAQKFGYGFIVIGD